MVVVVEAKGELKRALGRIPGALWVARVVAETVRICLRYRVTGLASEAGFFALLSFPPLILGLFGGVGYVGQWLGEVTIESFTQQIGRYAGRFLTPEVIDELLLPTVTDVFASGRSDLISAGFLLSLWSGSRALNVFMFDEPTAGMSVDEVPVVLDLIAQLKRDTSKMILLVEHKMDVVRSLADRIIVLHNGQLVADGKPAEVIASPIVQEAYLGIAPGKTAA